MATIEMKNVKGASAGKVDLTDSVFGIEPNVHAMHQVVRSQMAARRAGTHSTLTRGKVRGGGRKPWRQKGTGRARQGSIRSPQWSGGGVVWGPHPRDYAFKVPSKVVKLAMRSALSAKLADDELTVIDAFGFDAPSAKSAAAALAALGVDGRATIVVADDDVNTMLSLRNMPKIRVITATEANTYDLIDNTKLVFTKPALDYIGEVLS